MKELRALKTLTDTHVLSAFFRRNISGAVETDRRSETMKQVRDGLIGLAIGDALGVPVEFMTRKEIGANPVSSMREYGTHQQPKGTWSDDTSLTLALADSLGQHRGVDYKDIMDKFSHWLMYADYTAWGKVFDVGAATSRAIMNYGRGEKPIECGGLSEYDNGNGSLMRILPVAYYLCFGAEQEITDQMSLVHQVSSLTHRHPRSLMGCGIYVMAAKKLITTEMPLTECITQGVKEAFDYYDSAMAEETESYRRLRDIGKFKSLQENEIQSSGYVVHTLEAAFWCLLNSDSYEQCVLKAVNLGDDTDTVGAVAGGLAGIYYGISRMPAEWLDTIARLDYIEEICEKLQGLC